MVAGVFHRHDLVLPMHLQPLAEFPRAGDQHVLEVVLLEIDEGGHAVPGLGQQVELVNQFRVAEDLADLPSHALFQHGFRAAEAIEDLQRPLGVTEPARTDAHRVVVVQHEHRDAAHGQIQRYREAHGAGAGHYHGAAALAVCERLDRKRLIAVGLHHGGVQPLRFHDSA